jgi:isochorismate pyruvate lyase
MLLWRRNHCGGAAKAAWQPLIVLMCGETARTQFTLMGAWNMCEACRANGLGFMSRVPETSREPATCRRMETFHCQRHVWCMTDTLTTLRLKIDALDAELMTLLAEREKLVAQVLVHKKAESIPARIQSRIDEVVENAAAKALSLGANPDLARTVWASMVEWFVQHEERELKKS